MIVGPRQPYPHEIIHLDDLEKFETAELLHISDLVVAGPPSDEDRDTLLRTLSDAAL